MIQSSPCRLRERLHGPSRREQVAQTTRADLHVAIGEQHRRADQQDLQHRDGRDRRIDLPFEILQDRDRQRRAPRPDQEQAQLQIAERGDEAEHRGGDDAGQDRRAGSPAGRSCSGSAPRFCAASSSVRSKPARLAVTRRTVQGITISTCPLTSPAKRAEDRQPGLDLGLDMEHVERDAQHHAGHHQRHQQQVVERARGRESGSATGTALPARRRPDRCSVAITPSCRLSRKPSTNRSLPAMAAYQRSE